MAVDAEAICEAKIEGKTINDIAKEHNCKRWLVARILLKAGLVDEEDSLLSRERTTRMCAMHLKDLQREHGK